VALDLTTSSGSSHRAVRAASMIAIAGLWVAAALLPAAAARAEGATLTGSVRILERNGKSSYDRHGNGVVWLSGITSKPPSAVVTVNQRSKKFRPRVMPVVRGQTVNFYNRDDIEHNVFSAEQKQPFDLGHYPKDEHRSVTFDELGVFRVYCDIHKSMILDVVVVPSVYFAVTDGSGEYRIEGIPPGRYRLNMWHIYGGTHSEDLTIGDSSVHLERTSLTSTKVIRDIEEHLNKHGKQYKKKRTPGYR
jgi:plastocyanin